MERRESRQITIEELMSKFNAPKPGLRVDGLEQAMIDAQDLGHPDLKVVSMDSEKAIVKQKGKTITLKVIDGDFRITDLEFLVEGVMPAKNHYSYENGLLSTRILTENNSIIFVDKYKSSKYVLPDGKEIDVYNLSRFYSTIGQRMHGRDADYLKFEDLFTNFNPLTLAGNGLGLWVLDSYLPTDTDWEKPFEVDLKEGDKFTRLIKRVPSIPGRDIKAEVVVVGVGADKKVKPLSIELVNA